MLLLSLFVVLFLLLNATKLYTVFTRETVLAMKSILPNAYIYTIGAVPELNVTNAAFEAFDMVEQTQALDRHRCTLAEFYSTVRAFFFATYAQHFIACV